MKLLIFFMLFSTLGLANDDVEAGNSEDATTSSDENGAAAGSKASSQGSEVTSEKTDGDMAANASEPAKSQPYGMGYSFGMIRLKEGANNLNASGFGRIEIFRRSSRPILFLTNSDIGISYSGSDIGGKVGSTGSYRGVASSLGFSLSGFHHSFKNWRPRFSAGADIYKIRKDPAFSYTGAKREVSYKPTLLISESIYYPIGQGMVIGPNLGLQVGGVTGWKFGAEALFAF
jgi:hypothetical protein